MYAWQLFSTELLPAVVGIFIVGVLVGAIVSILIFKL